MIFRKKQVKVEAKPEHSTLVSTSTLTSSTTKEEFWALKDINFEIERVQPKFSHVCRVANLCNLSLTSEYL